MCDQGQCSAVCVQQLGVCVASSPSEGSSKFSQEGPFKVLQWRDSYSVIHTYTLSACLAKDLLRHPGGP